MKRVLSVAGVKRRRKKKAVACAAVDGFGPRQRRRETNGTGPRVAFVVARERWWWNKARHVACRARRSSKRRRAQRPGITGEEEKAATSRGRMKHRDEPCREKRKHTDGMSRGA